MSLICKHGLLFNHLRVGSATGVDYTVADHDPVSIDNHKLIVKPTSPRYSEVRLANMEIFTVIGNTCDVRAGDIIELDSSVDGTLPAITIYQKTPGAAVLGFKSDRIGAIYHGFELIYDNIRFTYLPSSDFPGRPFDREFKDTMNVPSIEVVTFKKILHSTLRNGEGLYLHQTDSTPDLKWEIQAIVEHGYCQVLTLRKVS